MRAKPTRGSSDKPLRAVALRYKGQDDAPRVVAKGDRLLAERIIALAHENGVHVQEDPDLVAMLSKLDVNTTIPESMFRAVAEILSFVYRINNRVDEVLAGKRE